MLEVIDRCGVPVGASVFPTTDRCAVLEQFEYEISASSASVFPTTDRCAVLEQFEYEISASSASVFPTSRQWEYVKMGSCAELSQRDRNIEPELHILSDHFWDQSQQVDLIDPVAQSSIRKASNAA